MWSCDTSLLAFSLSSSVFCLGFQKAAYRIQSLDLSTRNQNHTCWSVVRNLPTCSTRSWPVKKDTYMYVRDKLQVTDDVTKLLDDFQGFGLQRGWSSDMPSRTIFFNISGWWIRTDYPRFTDPYDLRTPTGPGPPVGHIWPQPCSWTVHLQRRSRYKLRFYFYFLCVTWLVMS